VYDLEGVSPLESESVMPTQKRSRGKVSLPLSIGKTRSPKDLYKLAASELGGEFLSQKWFEIKEEAKKLRMGDGDGRNGSGIGGGGSDGLNVTPYEQKGSWTHQELSQALVQCISQSPIPVSALYVFDACCKFSALDAQRFKHEKEVGLLANSPTLGEASPTPPKPKEFTGALVNMAIDDTDLPHKMQLGRLGREALTRVELIAKGTLWGRPVSRVSLTPHSGRRHQLRLHCLHLGHPIVGDYTYGRKVGEGEFSPPRMYLHACRLEVDFTSLLLSPGVCKRAKQWAILKEDCGALKKLIIEDKDTFEELEE